MPGGQCWTFGDFYLDGRDERLWRGPTCIPLGRKAFGVLVQLLAAPDRLVTKDELLGSVWPQVSVGEAVLTTAMREIRIALGDTAREPRFVQTVHGRGYRFIAPVGGTDNRPAPSPAGEEGIPIANVALSTVVGRDAELSVLQDWYGRALRGTRCIGFVAGEAGIGKSVLVDVFLSGLRAGEATVARGQCVEQYGGGEAYLPILEALGRLARDRSISLLLRERAPSWLAHLPTIDASNEKAPSTRPERMLRELSETIEVLSSGSPLILVLEDLHWSDHATLEWIGYVARRRDRARLLVLGTFRPPDAGGDPAPLRHLLAELRHQPQTREMLLDPLSRDAVRSYVHRRGSDEARLDDLADVLHQRTGGHPLFLASTVDALLAVVHASGQSSPVPDVQTVANTIPRGVMQFIGSRFERLSPQNQQLLEAASVAGDSFPVQAVAAVLSMTARDVEARCAALTHGGQHWFDDGEMIAWPDGTVGASFRFRHALLHESVYARVSPERRAAWHEAIGARLESAFGLRAQSIAGELAVHFERGRDFAKACTYLEAAAATAVQRSAYVEARGHVDRALDIVERLPLDRDRLAREARLSLLLAQVLEATLGWGAPDVERSYAKTRDASAALGDEPRLLQATWGLIAAAIVRADLTLTMDLTTGLLKAAKAGHNRLYRMAAHADLGGTSFILGRTSASARHFALAQALYDPGQHRACVDAFGVDLGIFGRIWSTHLLWSIGDDERATARAAETMRTAEALGHPFTLTVTLSYAAMLAQFRHDIEAVDRLASAAIARATEHGFPYYLGWAQVLRGWSQATTGADERALDEIRRGITLLETTARLRLPYYRALLADACGRFGRVDEALALLAQALEEMNTTGERWCESMLHRTRLAVLARSTRQHSHT
jgi:DNA-binding winged helix-turn-helix (wHTH) protein